MKWNVKITYIDSDPFYNKDLKKFKSIQERKQRSDKGLLLFILRDIVKKKAKNKQSKLRIDKEIKKIKEKQDKRKWAILNVGHLKSRVYLRKYWYKLKLIFLISAHCCSADITSSKFAYMNYKFVQCMSILELDETL